MELTFISSAHETLSRIDHIVGNKSSLCKFKKKNQITSRTFSDHSAIRLDINYRENIKNTNIWRINNVLMNHQQITEEIKRK